eukprot:CAMPEP_0185579660 /NCGR_PEP_ID=MMETSP0434-20130131/15335_1 /TAXON_ID=626734 ORGANISM="Favella taraikaensis, Strain Fe Narragansett Bay" /NCGR_SAMPLE_ID=MMETSP0434 /ASSEMBLY_ACC=CAM_ASM_000379 /LENGTH=70 /DNA_ID=CAMNT_0028197725 /DNA_START=513 /DNA_END=726 /DNA_ORIENTATION=-
MKRPNALAALAIDDPMSSMMPPLSYRGAAARVGTCDQPLHRSRHQGQTAPAHDSNRGLAHRYHPEPVRQH